MPAADRAGIAAHAAAAPTRLALVGGTQRWTFGELDARANQAARRLARAGVQSDDIVALAWRNRPEWYEALEGTWRLGAAVVGLPHQSTADELAYFVADSDIRVLLIEGEARARAAGLPFLAFDDYDPSRAAESADALPDSSSRARRRMRSYTSGTTGRPKALVVPSSPDGFAQMIDGGPFLESFGIDGPDEVHLCCAPLYHSQARGFSFFALEAGHTVVVMERFDAEEALRLIERERVTWLSMAPIHFVRILALPPETRARYDLSSIKLVLHAAASCPLHVKWQIMELFPPDVVWEVYGGTEGQATQISPQEWRRKPGSVGRAAPGATVKILDDDGNELPCGEVGNVYVSSSRVRRFAYLHDADATDKAWRGDFFTLREVGYLDEDGYLFLSDRKKHMIVTGGGYVSSTEVEGVLYAHPAVVDVAVIGLPDAEYGEIVTAVVQLREPVADSELVEHCRARLAPFKCPRRVVMVDELPRDPAGKVRKRDLRARLAPEASVREADPAEQQDVAGAVERCVPGAEGAESGK